MRCRLIVLLLAALLAQGCATRVAIPEVTDLCTATAGQSAGDRRMAQAVAEAQRQHVLFGGQLISRAGGIVRVGFHEAEFDRLPGETVPTWQRVAAFWTALDSDLPASFRSPEGGVVRIRELLDRIVGETDRAGGSQLDQRQRSALESALLRSALVDQPWSATFISYLMKTSGFGPGEFAFSDSHVDYVEQAVLASAEEAEGTATAYAFRACDIAVTPPRPGDLICHTRSSSSQIEGYADLIRRLAQRRLLPWRTPFPMHCDVVTRTNAGEHGSAGLEAIGGNVFQSVTLRQMTLDEGRTLSRAYFPSGDPLPRCEGDGDGCTHNLSQQPWVVLLQVRR